jgi:hypothetical protein
MQHKHAARFGFVGCGGMADWMRRSKWRWWTIWSWSGHIQMLHTKNFRLYLIQIPKSCGKKGPFPFFMNLCSIQIYIPRLHFKISDFQIHNLGCPNLLQLLVLPLVVGRWRITLNLLFYVQVWKKSYQHWEGCDSLMPQGGFGLGFSPCKD